MARQHHAQVNATNNEQNNNRYNIKIQSFDSKTESIEKFIKFFETQMKISNVPEAFWTVHLYQAMRGSAREALASIDNSENLAYNDLKKKILLYFNRSEDYYRIQFNTRTINKSDDPQNFIANLKSDLVNWIEMTEINKEYNTLIELLLVDKVLNMSTPELYSFIKERKIYSEKDLMRTLADFKDSHPNSCLAKNEVNVNGSRDLFAMREIRQNRHQSLPPRVERHNRSNIDRGMTCWSCGGIGHMQVDCRKRNIGRQQTCWSCGGIGHIQADCKKRNNNGQPRVGRSDFKRQNIKPGNNVRWNSKSNRFKKQSSDFNVMVQREETPDTSPDARREDRGRTKKREETMSTVLDNRGTLVLYPAFVNKKMTHMLKDSGCSTVAVHRDLIRRKDITNNVKKVKLGDGSIVECSTAWVEIDTPWVKGSVEALVMESLAAPLVLGNIPNMVQDNYDRLLNEWMVKKQTELKTILPDKHTLYGMDHEHKNKKELVSQGKLLDNYDSGKEKDTVENCSVVTRAQEKRCEANDREDEVNVNVETETIMNITKEQIIKEQQSDLELDTIKEKAKNEKSKGKGFMYIQGVLVKRKYNAAYVHKPEHRIVVPRTLKTLVLKAAHEIPLAAHMGHNKTWQRISKHFYWPKMYDDIKTYIKGCQTCCKHNDNNAKHKAPLQPMDLALGTFQKIAVDIIGPTTIMSNRKHRYILTIVDLCSRWVEAIPMKDIYAETVCHAMLGVFTKFGFPEKILSDNGTQFRSQLTAAFTRMLQITQVFSARYHPQSNGAVERANRTVKTMLRKVVQDNEEEWDRFLPMVIFAYNETPHESTSFSPFELIFGANPRGPLDILRREIITQDSKDKTAYEIVTNTREEIAYAIKKARDNLEQSSERQRVIRNKHRFLRQLEVGDKVLVYLPKGNNNEQSWQGPFTVEERVSNVDYKVEVKGISKTFHIDLLRKYYIDLVMANIAVESGSENITLHTPELERSNDVLQKIEINKDMPSEVRTEIMKIVNEYKDVISEVPGQTNVIQHKIKLNSGDYLKQKPYQVPYHYRKEVEKEIQLLLDNGLIQKSQSPYASPIVIVKKKNGKIRLCCDFRKINQITVIDREPLPNPEDLINEIANANIFTHLDCTRGFYQIKMDEGAKQYTAFTTHEGLYEWNVMPFGLVNSTATFVKMMGIILNKVPCVRHYVDDICIFTESWEEHIRILRDLFNILRTHNITVSPEKVRIGLTRLDFLGYNVGEGKIQPTKELARKILDIEKPKTKKNVRSLIGLCSFYRSFIPNFAEIVEPLGRLSKKDSPANIGWTDECEVALKKIKSIFQSEAILRPIDLSKNITLATDASKIGIGACLMQKHKGQFKPVLYLSRRLSEAEKKYSVIELECLAIFYAVTRLQKYLLGTNFDILVDHKPLIKFNSDKVKNNRVTRWALALQDYQFQIKSIKGCDNHLPDILSRMGN